MLHEVKKVDVKYLIERLNKWRFRWMFTLAT